MNEDPTYATDSIAAIIMLVFQYVPNAGKLYKFKQFQINCTVEQH